MADEHLTQVLQPQSDRDGFEALVKEFESLRTEIEWLIANGMRYQQFAIVITVAGLSASTFTISQQPSLYPALGYALSAVVSWLGVLYFWEHVEIHVVAGYIQQVLRPKVRKASCVDTWWEWEEYKGDQWKRKEIGNPNLFRVRLLSFCLIAFLFAMTSGVASWLNRCKLLEEPHIFFTSVFLLFGSLILLIRLSYLSIFKSDLSRIFLCESNESTPKECGSPKS
jgi:hypothetical protein